MTNKIQHFPSRLWHLLFLALPLAACTSEVTDEDLQGDASPIAFRTAEVTKAVVENFTSGDAFSVWGGYDNDATGVFNNETVSYNGTAWTYTGGDRYWVFDKTYDFYAVYPTTVDAEVETDGTITINNFNSSDIDLMTADNTGIKYAEGATTEAVSFTFRHELARVNIVVQVDPEVEVTNLSATLEGYDSKGTLTRPKNGTATWTGTVTDTKDETYNSIQANSSQDLFGDLLLIPQSTEDITLTLNLTRDDSPVEYTAHFDESVTAWSAGQAYRYVLHIRVDAITFSNFTTDEWGETHTGGDINIGGDTDGTNQGN